MLNRRTFFTGSATLLAAALLPATAVHASSCGKNPAALLASLSLLDQLAPGMAATQTRTGYYAALIDFSYTYMVALNGQPGQPAYHQRDDAQRQAFLEQVFARSSATLQAMQSLKAEFQSAGLTGPAMDFINLQIASFGGDYDVRRPHMAQAVALLDDPLVSHDAILADAAKALREAIEQVGNGNVQRAIGLAWASSPHHTPRHFQHFLPMVSPAGDIVFRMAQLKQGARPIPPSA